MKKLEHIPFLDFEGIMKKTKQNQITYFQMQKPIGRLTAQPMGKVKGEIYNGNEWIEETPFQDDSSNLSSYSSFWGSGNFALAKLFMRLGKSLFSRIQIAGKQGAHTRDVGNDVLGVYIQQGLSV